MKKVKIGIVGCGNISGIYLEQSQTFDILETVACADLLPERAQAQAQKYHIPRALTVEELLADPEIEIVVNLTIPKAHASVALAALEAGKSVYNEKPLAITREEGQKILALAKEKGLLVGAAPDTFLGAGIQTCVHLIDRGEIGDPVAATAFMMCHGHESWHPDPEFYYKVGGGPLFDMGPYYLTALIAMLGPVRRVSGSARISFPTRTITSQPKAGTVITVDTPTHLSATLDFRNGAVVTLVTSFDVWAHHLPNIEVHGASGSLSVPDPNTFGGQVQVWKPETRQWENVPLLNLRAQNSRSIGVADMAYALRTGRPHRANGQMAYHVLDVMHAVLDASCENQAILVESTCEKPAPLPADLPPNQLDA
uniref:Gfo/Idh/MocA family oxidoreductase n=1 Tax=Anaerolinea thermolimosa TaxID=229919 RepID=A0A7C4PKY0_9CHLR